MARGAHDALAALGAGETGVVVTHGAALKVGAAGAPGLAARARRDARGMDNCGWAVLASTASTAGSRLAAYNRRTVGAPDFASD